MCCAMLRSAMAMACPPYNLGQSVANLSVSDVSLLKEGKPATILCYAHVTTEKKGGTGYMAQVACKSAGSVAVVTTRLKPP